MENHPLQLLQFIIKPRISYMENHHQIMENNNNNSKAEVLKPIFLKAGIPLAITVAGFVFAKLTQRTRPNPITSNHVQVDSQSEKKHEEEGIESPSIVESNDSSEEEAEVDINHYSVGSSVHSSEAKIDKIEIESSKSRVQELEDEMKHQELMLFELHNKLSNEIARVELFEREISALEAGMLRLESIGLDVYLKIVKLLAISGLEKGLLRKRVKKLFKRCKQQSHLIKEQSLKIEGKEMEIQRNHEQKLEIEANVRIKMEAEIEELKTIVAELQNEKNELVNQIDLANKTISSKIEEEEEAIKASYEQVVCETEELVKERAMEAKELVYLRWCNACLRHELMRRNEEQLLRLNNGEEISDIRSDDEIDYSSRSEHTPHHHPPSKRVKIIQKLKRWMDKHERMVR